MTTKSICLKIVLVASPTDDAIDAEAKTLTPPEMVKRVTREASLWAFCLREAGWSYTVMIAKKGWEYEAADAEEQG